MATENVCFEARLAPVQAKETIAPEPLLGAHSRTLAYLHSNFELNFAHTSKQTQNWICSSRASGYPDSTVTFQPFLPDAPGILQQPT